jgi:hypothetical protein
MLGLMWGKTDRCIIRASEIVSIEMSSNQCYGRMDAGGREGIRSWSRRSRHAKKQGKKKGHETDEEGRAMVR